MSYTHEVSDRKPNKFKQRMEWYRNSIYPLEMCFGYSTNRRFHFSALIGLYYFGLAFTWKLNPARKPGERNIWDAELLLPFVKLRVNYRQKQ